MSIIDKFIKIVLLISIIVFAASFFKKDALPNRTDILEELYSEPIQTEIDSREFVEKRKGTSYLIEPLFDYKLYGLIVAYHHSKSWFDISHERWKDFINTKDITVIWGYNLKEGDYQQVRFSHGDFTGYYQLPCGPIKFKPQYFSNNHLLAANAQIEKTFMQARTGDQIYLEGYLINYAHSKASGMRNTSITREDTGNNSCEIIYVTGFEILKKANPEWRFLHTLSKFTVIGCVVLLLGLFVLSPGDFRRKEEGEEQVTISN